MTNNGTPRPASPAPAAPAADIVVTQSNALAPTNGSAPPTERSDRAPAPPPARYEPKDHIQHLEIAPRAEGILEQREITVQAYETKIPFDFQALDAALGGAWLQPAVRLGVFSREPCVRKDEIHVVLGLQGDLSVRAYDYDARRPLWYSWHGLVVDVVAVRYVRDENGFLRFTTAGSRQRITEEKLAEFHAAFLGIPRDAVRPLQFDLAKLRLCFDRFSERLYMLRFANSSRPEYVSIDHALFKSRRYIDPKAERLKEVLADPQVTIESFDSDVAVQTEDLAVPAEVRFEIRGLRGALRLKFPKVVYKTQFETSEEQTRVFYRLVDETSKLVLDADYYARQQLSLIELEKFPEFPEFANTAPYREVLSGAEARREFLARLDLGAAKQQWLPHLRALDELLATDAVRAHVAELMAETARTRPPRAVALLSTCHATSGLATLAAVAADALGRELHAITPELRGPAEEALLAWAIDHDADGWDIDVATGEIGTRGLRWKAEDLSIDALTAVLWKLMGVLHARLRANPQDAAALLAKYDWCVAVAGGLPKHQPKAHAAIRLLAAGCVPRAPHEARSVLREPVDDFAALDDALLAQFGLPLWPCLRAQARAGGVALVNHGVGAALAVTLATGSATPRAEGVAEARSIDLPPGGTVVLPHAGRPDAVVVTFTKFGSAHRATVPVVAGDAPAATTEGSLVKLRPVIERRRLENQRTYRSQIDPDGVVCGESPVLLRVFEDIHYANAIEGGAPVLLLGEPGVGKTHIAEMLHASSERRVRPFKAVNAGGGGGDLNIQRGEWIGYAKGHGIAGVDPAGRLGHVAEVSGGTLFIDEFAVMSPGLQVIFLSILDRRGVEQVGGGTVTPNVRCVFATNADLDEEVGAGRLRRDLLDRIAVRIAIPSLRERRGDVVALAKRFAGEDVGIDARCVLALLRHDWPGNVRELHNKIRAAVARRKSDGAGTLRLEHVELPGDVVAIIGKLDDDAVRRELWVLADAIARDEGFDRGNGLQRRAGVIVGVGETQASRAYQAVGLAGAVPA